MPQIHNPLSNDDHRGASYAVAGAGGSGIGFTGFQSGSPAMVYAGVALASIALFYAAFKAKDISRTRSALFTLAAAAAPLLVHYGLATENDAATIAPMVGQTLGLGVAGARTPTVAGAPRSVVAPSEPPPEPDPTLTTTGSAGEQVIEVDTSEGPASEEPPSWATR